MVIKKDILSYTSAELAPILSELGWEKYRIGQLNSWLWKHCVRELIN